MPLFLDPSQILFLFLKLNTGNSFPPPLPPQQEQAYFEAARKGDKKAREALIEHNLRLVAHIVRKYYIGNKNQEDLMSIGTIGLIKAIDSFDPSNGARFATYACRCLQNEILMYFRGQKKLAGEISINETIDTDREGNPLTYSDIISCEDTIAEDIDTKVKSVRAMKFVNSALTQREKEIIIMRYGLGDTRAATQREIAQKLGISRSYVSRIEKSALDKISTMLSRPGLYLL